MTDRGYIHTFSKKEQDRLLNQALFLEPYLYPGIEFSACRRILEIGCGVGAQIALLARRFPGLRIDGLIADRNAVFMYQGKQIRCRK